ncbi:MAG: hypothetical protein Q9228_007842, partial [Teloschistes exilis]
GKYDEAERMNRRALDGREKMLGIEHPHTLTSVSNLASVLQDQGKYDEAEQMNQRALDGREKVLGKEHPDTLTSVSNLALVLQDQGKYDEAERMNRRALDGNLASVLQNQGKYEEAERMNRRALDGPKGTANGADERRPGQDEGLKEESPGLVASEGARKVEELPTSTGS